MKSQDHRIFIRKRKHNGMRPHDIIILLKILNQGITDWYIKDLGDGLGISQSEVCQSVYRFAVSGLLTPDKKEVIPERLFEFLIYGIRYVFPYQFAEGGRGMPTAHSAWPLDLHFPRGYPYIWPDKQSRQLGRVVVPLHPGVPEACRKDEKLYALLSLVDTLRISIREEKDIIIEELRKRIL